MVHRTRGREKEEGGFDGGLDRGFTLGGARVWAPTAALDGCAGRLRWAVAPDDACRVSLSVAEIALFPTNEDDH